MTMEGQGQADVSQVKTARVFAKEYPKVLPPLSLSLFFSQFKDFLSTYNRVTENCFTDCIQDFTTRKITGKEVRCGIDQT